MRLFTPGLYSTSVYCTVNIGGVTEDFNVTTEVEPYSPPPGGYDINISPNQTDPAVGFVMDVASPDGYFLANSVIYFDSVPQTTTYVSPTALTVTLSSGAIPDENWSYPVTVETAGSFSETVYLDTLSFP